MPILIDLVRIFLKDSPETNELDQTFEFKDRDIELACNLAISDWNTTPPLIRPQKLETFICIDWLVIATAINCLSTLVPLNARNQLAYSDGGITVDRWNKAPIYMAIIQYWQPILEKKKVAFKYAQNVASFAGSVASPERYMGLYPIDISMAASVNVKPPPKPKPQPKPVTVFFTKADWQSLDGDRWSFAVKHNLRGDVDIRLTDPGTKEDLRSRARIYFNSDNTVLLAVSKRPDGRFDARAVVYRI